jgi:hypothetical protein
MNHTLEERITALEERNARVEANKARETSRARRGAIAFLTYLVIVIFFFAADLPQPRINAIVPTVGFVLSTLSLSVLRRRWMGRK